MPRANISSLLKPASEIGAPAVEVEVEEDEEEDEESVSPFEWWKGSDGTSMMRMLGGFEGARDSERSTRVTDGVGWKAWSVQLDVQRAASTNGLRFWWYDHALSLCVCVCGPGDESLRARERVACARG